MSSAAVMMGLSLLAAAGYFVLAVVGPAYWAVFGLVWLGVAAIWRMTWGLERGTRRLRGRSRD